MQYWDKECAFEELAGHTVASVEDLKVGEDSVRFVCADGTRFVMKHDQDCCESVQIEEIIGDISDLIGAKVITSVVTTSSDDPEGYKRDYPPESVTWTFYTIQTEKGAVTIRWLGESNGYYSESVSLYKL